MPDTACPFCGAANPEGFRFCGSCGFALERICPSCGVANPAANRFCGSCGTDLDAGTTVVTETTEIEAAPALEERKVVSMLFADLTASTEMASRLDPEDLRAVLRPFFDAMAEEIERYGGTVEKFIGDAVVAAFGAPVAHEDDPERSIRCALAMQRRLPQLNAVVAERAGGNLAMRIGINTGEVVSHSIEEGIVTGEAVNIAARLQSLAEPGRVVVGERTYRDARDAFSFTDLGEITVKGIDRPLRVFEVAGELSEPRARAGRVSAPFVGRDAEMDLLRVVYDRTLRERRPNLVTLVGPPGIGKSRLSHEVAQTLAAGGALVVRGRCLPYGDGLTYWPLAEILKADAGILDSDTAGTMLDKARARLDPRFPGEEGMGVTSTLLSSIGVELSPDPLAGAEPEAAHRLIARAWQRYLEALAAEHPLVALIEDVHWADPSLLELVETVVVRTNGPVLVLCMARPELFERHAGWGGGLANATTISLSPLSAGDGTELIENLLGGKAPAEVVGPILQRCEGNPFFAGELIRMMVEDGTIAQRDDGRWDLIRELPSSLPDTVQGVIASRIDLLLAEEKRAIQDASVIGRTFWQGAVARLGSPDAGRAIEGLVAKGLVWERDISTIAGERELIFNHVLTRDVAYGSIPRVRRAQAHAIVGAWIEEGTGGRVDEFAEILAHHFALAGDETRTARYGLVAGQRLLRVFAAGESITWLDRALEAAGVADPSMTAEIALVRGLAREQLNRFEEARADYELALTAAGEAGDENREARALAAIPHVLWLLDRYDEGQALLPLALERARKVGIADAEARLLYTAGTMRFGRGEYADALPLHEQALEVARGSGDMDGEALAHHGLCETYYFEGPHDEGLMHGLEADRLFRELGQRPMVAHNGYMVAALLHSSGRPDDAMVAADASLDTATEMGSGREAGFALINKAWINLSVGHLDSAMINAESGLANFRALGLARGEIAGLLSVNEASSEVWDLERIGASARAALEISDRIGGTFVRPHHLAYSGWSALATGDGEAMLSEARTMSTALLDRAWVGKIEVLASEWAGDPEALRSAAEWIEELVLPRSVFWGTWGRYARALGAQLQGRHDEAIEAGALAREAVIASGDRRLQWRVARVLWRSLDALERPSEAAGFRKEAAALIEDVAANATGSLREAFLARPDVAEVLA